MSVMSESAAVKLFFVPSLEVIAATNILQATEATGGNLSADSGTKIVPGLAKLKLTYRLALVKTCAPLQGPASADGLARLRLFFFSAVRTLAARIWW